MTSRKLPVCATHDCVDCPCNRNVIVPDTGIGGAGLTPKDGGFAPRTYTSEIDMPTLAEAASVIGAWVYAVAGVITEPAGAPVGAASDRLDVPAVALLLQTDEPDS